MAQDRLLSNPVTSVSEINEILRSYIRPRPEDLDKSAFQTLLSGFQVFVKILEVDENGVNLNDVIEWMRFYLRTHMVVLNCERKLTWFLKTVPIAITYIIGLLKHAPSYDANFYTEVLNITYKLVRLTDRNILKDLEKYGRVISLLWDVIDKVGQFNTQMQILQLFIMILKELESDFAFNEVKNLRNVKSNELIYKILELIRMRNDDDLFKKLVRSVLNQYNLQRNFDAHVQSFHCKSFEIGTNLKFSKPTYSDRFWFDINKNPYTLTIEARFAPKGSRKYQNANIVLKIKEMFTEDNYLKIEFIPSAEILGNDTEFEELNGANTARITLCKSEFVRFEKFFNVPSKRMKTPVEILSVVDVTPNIPINKTKALVKPKKMTMNSSLFASEESMNKSSRPLIRKNIPHSSLLTNAFVSKEVQKQIQHPSNKADIIHQQKETTTTIMDEYDNIDVSDAEPCQSYKSFSKRKHTNDNDPELSLRFNQLKRSFNNKSSSSEYPATKRFKEINVWDYGPSTSRGISNSSRKSILCKNDFDVLKNGASSSKSMLAHNDKVVDITNDDSMNLNDTQNAILIDLSMDNEALNSKTPEPKNSFEIPKSISDTINVSTALITYEPNKIAFPNQKGKDDCLVYHKRSDIESSSDDSEFEIHRKPKRKFYTKHRPAVKKRLFDLSRSDVASSDKDMDCDVTEFILVAKKDFHANMNRLNTTLSSIFQSKTSRNVCRGNNKNVQALHEIEDFIDSISYKKPYNLFTN